MPREQSESRFPPWPPPSGADEEDRGVFRFLRGTHLLASAVEEVLDARPAAETTTDHLSPSEIHLLRVLQIVGPQRLGAVAENLGVSSPAATRTIDKLERLNLVSRAPFDGDRRGKVLGLAPRGEEIVAEFEKRRRERVEQLLATIDADALDHFSRVAQWVALSLFQGDRPGRGHCLRCGVHLEAGCPIGKLTHACPLLDSQPLRRPRRSRRPRDSSGEEREEAVSRSNPDDSTKGTSQ